MKGRNFLGLNLLIAMAMGIPGSGYAITIDFNDVEALSAIPLRGQGHCLGRGPSYTEDGMTLLPRVQPPDPALGGTGWDHFHLSFENINAFSTLISACGLPRTPEREDALLGFAARFPRFLQPHGSSAVIQMTYDPDGNGVPDPFNLISLQVVSGKLNVGVKGPFGIAVYNNLAAGPTGTVWTLLGPFNQNLTRATLEGTNSIFGIDNIVFEPAGRATTMSDLV